MLGNADVVLAPVHTIRAIRSNPRGVGPRPIVILLAPRIASGIGRKVDCHPRLPRAGLRKLVRLTRCHEAEDDERDEPGYHFPLPFIRPRMSDPQRR